MADMIENLRPCSTGLVAGRAHTSGLPRRSTHARCLDQRADPGKPDRQPSVRLYGEHTAIETGYYELILVDAKGQATTRYGKYSTTLVKSGERWLVVMSHRSPLLVPPAGPAR
jgi:Calcium/calmodulin dependent protein kinase II association domain